MGFTGKRFSAKSSPPEEVQGEKGQATREVTKIKVHVICRTDTEALFALTYSDGISKKNPAYNCPYSEPEEQKHKYGKYPPGWNKLVSTCQPVGR